MIEITFPSVLILITAVWLLIRTAAAVRNRKVNWRQEAKLLTVYCCIAVIARLVYFPWHLENGRIGTLVFDPEKIRPLWINAVPFVRLFDRYEGWQRNLFGNIAMFSPVGLVWPFCFKKLDSVGKTVLAGAAFSLLIELSQLLFYQRGTDVDDLITNTAGALIGALIYFLIRRLLRRRKTE